MLTITYMNVVDKAGWGDGPWNSEPDKVQWFDDETGLPCLVVRGPMGALCGYVGVTEDHPLFGKKYDTAEAEADLDVHGGLTFSDLCMDETNGGQAERVCHIPEPRQSDRVWWLGFDCGHFMDLVPRMEMTRREMEKRDARLRELRERIEEHGPREVYRDIDYVRSEVAALARQLASSSSGS